MSESDRPLRFGTIVVVGGGCYGSYYVRQLRRAASAGAVTWTRVLVVDQNRDCALVADGNARVGELSSDRVDVVVDDWRAFFKGYLDDAAAHPDTTPDDAIVPSPLMPHLMFEWILGRARERWPGRDVVTAPLESAPDVPWQRATPAGPHYVSFAEWICPINCIEPATCPHTRAARTWSLPVAARAYVGGEQGRGRALAGPVIFHCTHRAYGVGMFDTREVLAGDNFVRSLAEKNAAEVLVGTMSHCHGAFERLVIGPPTGSEAGPDRASRFREHAA
ncbi:MAG TPA: hypothetical protein VGH98_17440 [Gemmatimonadaceae bacterium]|jgi:hypothetical protein